MLNRIKLLLNQAPPPVRSRYLQARDAYKYLRHGRFFALKQFANGMLAPHVYREMYERVRALPDLDIVEIGGAHGAGSIAIAWALLDSGKTSKVITVEKCEGGSRSDFGDKAENLDTIVANLHAFGVADKVDLFPHYLNEENTDNLIAKIDTPQLAGLILDADGRLDRDFKLLWERLAPGALIIVDDYDNRPEYKAIDERNPDGGTKKVLTYRLLNQLETWGLFERDQLIGDTLFGQKPANADFSQFDEDALARIVDDVETERASAVGER